jgi:hypothetical protein
MAHGLSAIPTRSSGCYKALFLYWFDAMAGMKERYTTSFGIRPFCRSLFIEFISLRKHAWKGFQQKDSISVGVISNHEYKIIDFL